MAEPSSNKMVGDSPAAQHRASPTIEFADAALVDKCRKGDMQAFGHLVAKYQDRVYNLIMRLCGNPSDAEELAQETFLKALERISQFRGQSGFYTWLFRIAANLTISHRRRGGRCRFQSLSPQDEHDSNLGGSQLSALLADQREASPQAAAISSERAGIISRALEKLDEEFRLIVVLRDVEDMDYAQISDVLGVPVGTVKSRLHRARCILKDKLADLMQ